jgi:hypothetical protein
VAWGLWKTFQITIKSLSKNRENMNYRNLQVHSHEVM